MNSRKTPKSGEETMKTVILTPNSSVKSTTTVNSSASEVRDSAYFPGCRKDANCNCEICVESFKATRDLMMPQSMHRSSLTKMSTSKVRVSRSPVSFSTSSDDLSTPKPRTQIKHMSDSQPVKNVASMNLKESVKKGNKGLGFWRFFVRRWCLGLLVLLGLECVVPLIVSGALKTRFSPEITRNMCEKSWDFATLNSRFLFLNQELERRVGRKISGCSSNDSVWKISQDGLLLNSRCVLYESESEEISIWGWPLQTAGLLTSQYSSRSFSIISGRAAQWSSNEATYLIREGNSSWCQGKWTASAVQFDQNTWILEYRQSFLLDNPKLVSAAVEFLKLRIRREFEKTKQEFWPGNRNSHVKGGSIAIPT